MQIAATDSRVLEVTAEAAEALLDGLGSPCDGLWSPRWPKLRLDRPLAVGAAGGHGPIRYQVTTYRPGREVRFAFRRMPWLSGEHWFILHSEKPDAGPSIRGATMRLEHGLHADGRGPWIWLWPLLMKPLHEAPVTDALDRANQRPLRKLHGWIRLASAILMYW